MKIQKKNWGVGVGGSGWGGGQGGCEWRSEAFVKIQKKIFFWGGGRGRVRGSDWGGVRVDGNGEMNLLWGGGAGGSGRGGGASGWGVRVDVNGEVKFL